MADYLPFPTFGGQQQGSGITAVQLPASAMRFPSTSYTPSRKVPEPDPIETIAPFLPLVTEGIMGLFQDEPEQLTREAYLEKIGGLKEAEEDGAQTLQNVLYNQKQQAKADTYELYGERTERETFGLGEIAHIVAASQMGRGADDYASTYFAIKKAEETARLATQTGRATYLNKALEEVDNLQMRVFEDTDAAALGIPTARNGFIDPRGEIYVMNDDKTGYVNVKDLEGNWVQQKEATSYTDQFTDPKLQELHDRDIEAVTVDGALLSTIGLTNEVITLLDAGIADDTVNPLTVVNTLGNIVNSVTSNVGAMYAYMTFGDENDDGAASQGLFQALQSGDEAAVEAAMARFEGLGLKTRGGKDINFKELLGDAAYANVRTRSAMLQLAYMAAAANGQTGRTLSDKDLAFHLDMIGFGNTDDAQTAKDNLLGFVDGIINQHDNRTRASISLNRIATGYFPMIDRAGNEDQRYTGTIASYWEPPINEEDGSLNWGSKIMKDWTYRDLRSRHRFNPDMERYETHIRIDTKDPFDMSTGAGTGTGDISTETAADAQLLDSIYRKIDPSLAP